MATEMRMPRIGQSMTEGTVTAWLLDPGAAVAAGEPVVAVETDKTEFEVEAPIAGVLGTVRVPVGETVPVGEVLALILATGESETATAVPSTPRQERVSETRIPEALRSRDRVRASPKARKLAEARGVDLATLEGTGPDGLITHQDVGRAATSERAGPHSDEFQGRTIRERRPLPPAARAGARRTQQAWQTAPHFVQMVDVDMSRVVALRAHWKATGDPRAAVTVGDLFVAATARGLAVLPELNAAYEDGSLLLFEGVHVGIAVDTPRGLLVPVVRNADRLDLVRLSERIRELAASARSGALSPDSLRGGTATVSNLGAYGIRMGTPVLNSPEPLLVFVGAMEDRVVAIDGVPGVRPETTLSIAYDHRVADGARASEFTRRVRLWLEKPEER